MDILGIGKRVIGPILDIVKGRQERKKVLADTDAKIKIARQEGENELTLKRHEVEALAVQGLQHTWKDEYVTVSMISIFNIITIGGLAAAFGAPQMLEGISVAVQTLVELGIDVGQLISITVYTSLGLYVFRRNF